MQADSRQINISGLLHQAVRHHQSGETQTAELIYKRILDTDPNHPDALHLLGLIMHRSGQHQAARQLIEKAIAVDAGQAFYFHNLANVYSDLGDYAQATRCFQQALALKPDYAEAFFGLASIYQMQGNLTGATSCYKKAVQFELDSLEAYFKMGQFFETVNHVDDAIRCYQKVAQSNCADAGAALMKLGAFYGQSHRLAESTRCFQKVLEMEPESPSANYNLGLAFQKQHAFEQAISAYNQALEQDPEYTDAYFNLGVIYHKQGELERAIRYYQKALQLKPDYAAPYNNLGLVLQKQGKHDDATRALEKALQLDPDYGAACGHLVHHLQYVCDWEKLRFFSDRLDQLTCSALAKSERTPEPPFANLTRHADPLLNLAVAKSWVPGSLPQVADRSFNFQIERGRQHRQITIGYLSNNFGNHPVAHLMLNLYGSHDRRSFKVNCYSYGRADGYTYRRIIEQDCDNFVDIFDLSHVESARRIYGDGVDILVDLVGHTEDNRMTICGYRPAPIQVSYLGFLGSSGADFMDYIITDRVVTPEAHARYYSENFVYMPHSYQINDYLTETSETSLKRRDVGLSDDSFVFCSFNKPYKIEPVMFDSWMKILRKVDNSVLWLVSGGTAADGNLKLAARERGVDSGRLIFAEMVLLERHLERLQLADLALDTRIYNGGATTSNALGAGVPLITLLGNHFVSRMSASSLQAIGLPELITRSLEEHEALAVRLARNPAELQSIRQKLKKNRLVEPLFDHRRHVRNLENAYRQMWEIFLAGERPRQIEVMDTVEL